MTKGILRESIHHVAQERREQTAAARPQRVLGGISFLSYSIKYIGFSTSKAVLVNSAVVKGGGANAEKRFYWWVWPGLRVSYTLWVTPPNSQS